MKSGLIICSFFLLTPVLAQADDFQVGDLFYSILSEENKTVSVENGNKLMAEAFPASIRTEKNPTDSPDEVTLGTGYFNYQGNYCKGDIVVPPSIEYNGETYTVVELADGAFARCVEMTSISLPETIKTVGPGAFYSCIGLQELDLPNSVESIAYEVCLSCTGLKKVRWADAVEAIPAGAFSRYVFETAKVDELVIENAEKVTTIGNNAFTDSPIKHYPSWGGLKSIGEAAFYGSLLEEVTIPQGCDVDKTAFNACSELKTLELPEDCPENISEYFASCSAIETIRIAAVTPPALSDDWARNVAAGCVLEVPEESVALYREAEYWKEFSEIISSGVVTAEADGLQVGTSAGHLTVKSLNEAQTFDTAGHLLYSGTYYDLCLPAGIYIVKAGARSVKVNVK